MATALYRRYRPETFADVVGQAHVTDPLMTALRTNRVNHAYLFSGPRGCGKTTSARILARCLNCAEGPTDTPCGVCPSCVELSREGGGSLDVVEIDAASHNGVDDARDLRERAVFAPARDRYKIFILDEAHMVTPQGFNALLKLVEEPPEHVKFIFATTEPDKVIGTIRSRTHHYPFRLIPPALLLEYCEGLCTVEGISVEPGVLQLVVRAGGGSARDTLSLLDQLIAGSENNAVSYERAVALLGYTHSSLLDEVINALAAGDSAASFGAVDRVIETGQDPRRFVEDLLERLRDLILVNATGPAATGALRGVVDDEMERMQVQAKAFGAVALSRAADIVNSSLSEMTGATSPRLHLELMIARLLVRVETPEARSSAPETQAPVAVSASQAATVADLAPPATPVVSAATAAPAPPVPSGPVGTTELLEVWPTVLEKIQSQSRPAWIVVVGAEVRSLEGDVLSLAFSNQSDLESFKPRPGVPGGVHEILRQAIADTVGVTVKFKVSSDGTATAPIERLTDVGPVPQVRQVPTATASVDDWAVVAIPGGQEPTELSPVQSEPELAPVTESEPVTEVPATPAHTKTPRATNSAPAADDDKRYGEAVVREILGATFVEEIITDEA